MSRQETRRQETRTELIAAATGEFLDRGFHATSLQSVARRAGFTTGAIYGHFGDKDELFLAVYEEYARTRVAEMVAPLFQGGRLPEQARLLADQWMERHAANPEFAALTLEFVARAIRRPPLLEAFAARHATVRVALERLLEDAARRDGIRLPLPAAELATVLRDLGIGLALAQLVEPDTVPARLFGDFTATVFEPRATPAPDPEEPVDA